MPFVDLLHHQYQATLRIMEVSHGAVSRDDDWRRPISIVTWRGKRMKLNELKELLENNPNKRFLLNLPNGREIPQSFHVTEVGFVSKSFIDCCGKKHSVETCQLQVWIGSDADHRMETDKLKKILQISSSVLPNDLLDVEVEYEDHVISQYPISNAVVSETSVTLHLTTKHTDCLAKDLCLPRTSGNSSCCGGSSCC